MDTVLYIVGCVALGMVIGNLAGSILFHVENSDHDRIYTEFVQESESINKE